MNIGEVHARGAVEVPEARKFMASRLTDFLERKGALADWIAHSREWLMKILGGLR